MATTICFDFGNTRKKYAVFDNAAIREIAVLENDDDQTIRPLIEKIKPDYTILSSVIDHNPKVDELLAASSKFHRLGILTKLPFTTPVGKPETIGADRLALAAAAVQF